MCALEKESARGLETLGDILSWAEVPKIIMQHWSIFVKKPCDDYRSTIIYSQEYMHKVLVFPVLLLSPSQLQNMKL